MSKPHRKSRRVKTNASRTKFHRLTADHVQTISLRGHLALAAYCAGFGDKNQLYALARATYLSYFLWQEGYGSANRAFYCSVESELDELARRGETNNDWSIHDASFEVIRLVLGLYDDQISSVSTEVFEACERQLGRLLKALSNSADVR
ncbi:Fis family transcriptional regulator [Caballeronia udeis]|uniref:Fis family transcriptional regulator n=1 Tax=Caballeronia udeis TaxID=1232866 RepID=A0A158K163_9BURK|nr:hypothetical protein [Caballeronia udeis]SAL74705.1 Fis family transcriptional regulator [Caballeronia udeis]